MQKAPWGIATVVPNDNAYGVINALCPNDPSAHLFLRSSWTALKGHSRADTSAMRDLWLHPLENASGQRSWIVVVFFHMPPLALDYEGAAQTCELHGGSQAEKVNDVTAIRNTIAQMATLHL